MTSRFGPSGPSRLFYWFSIARDRSPQRKQGLLERILACTAGADPMRRWKYIAFMMASRSGVCMVDTFGRVPRSLLAAA